MRVVFLLLLLLPAVFWPRWFFSTLPLLIHVALGWIFFRSLRDGREPVISRIARLDRGTLTGELELYTRRLTWIWAAMFVLLAVLSLYLALAGPAAGFALSYILVALLFFGEHVYRRLRYPHYEHTSPWHVIRRICETGALR